MLDNKEAVKSSIITIQIFRFQSEDCFTRLEASSHTVHSVQLSFDPRPDPGVNLWPCADPSIQLGRRSSLSSRHFTAGGLGQQSSSELCFHERALDTELC